MRCVYESLHVPLRSLVAPSDLTSRPAIAPHNAFVVHLAQLLELLHKVINLLAVRSNRHGLCRGRLHELGRARFRDIVLRNGGVAEAHEEELRCETLGESESVCVVLRLGRTYLVHLLLLLLHVLPSRLKALRLVKCGLRFVPETEKALLESEVVPY